MLNQKGLIAISGNQLRHRFFLSRMTQALPIDAVFQENHAYTLPSLTTEADKQAWEWFFTRRDAYEADNLKETAEAMDKSISSFEIDHINDERTLELVSRLDPGLILIFGTRLMGERWLELFHDRILNLHLGLPEFYRGSSCTFWPVHDGRPDLLGASVHRVDAGIDTGEVILKAGTRLNIDDDEQTLAGKTLMLGCRLMIEAVKNMDKMAKPQSMESKGKGRLCRIKDFSPRAIQAVRQKVESGLLKDEIKKIKARKEGLNRGPGVP